MTHTSSRSLHVIGAGLIGTSIALAAREHGLNVSVEDSRTANEALAFDLLNGKSSTSQTNSSSHDPVDLVVVAVPPEQTAKEVSRALKEYPQSLIIDVASVKTKVIAEVKDLSDAIGRFIPTHPIAGRQFHGPAAAQADLFKNRPWILTPLTQNSSEDVQRVGSLLSALGANLHRMTAEEHDAIFARVSHLPQILSTLLSATLRDQPGAVAFSGQGFRDMTRLAESDGGLWAQIIPLNSEEILIALQEFKASLNKIERAIELNDASTILKVFQEGKSTRTLLAGKHGGVPRDYIFFRIVIDDRPGVLAELFALCGEVNVNVEDLTIEHSPNQETGLITLAIAPEHKTPLEMILNDRSWNFHLDPSLESLE